MGKKGGSRRGGGIRSYGSNILRAGGMNSGGSGGGGYRPYSSYTPRTYTTPVYQPETMTALQANLERAKADAQARVDSYKNETIQVNNAAEYERDRIANRYLEAHEKAENVARYLEGRDSHLP